MKNTAYPNQLQKTFGNIDIYLFDQLLKGRYDNCKKILDVGCGNGRNLVYFLQHGYEVFGVDPHAQAVETVRGLSAALAPDNPLKNFMVCTAEDLPYTDGTFDLIICSAVLHFAKDVPHFDNMLQSMFRVLKPGGYFFARLASDIGIEHLVKPLGNDRYLLPDGSERFLVNEQVLLKYTSMFGVLYEPIKTTNVQNLRCMTTWCVQKH
ncbi:methyltransferase type 11 [Niastella yeongjuensis]|uniref:Methyltransferase type 11 n=1 Tax=Niastella yeongjuensis TaxID=354355 RepID=A0A1V9EPL2_9BACT|nr:class I SAM-dependent methyltransferase [Niastella yeongjuensis]OQP48067.1 methyltransferase type 11 [Niastella yeongjuensis]SEO25488.1 Methyltransferase domain-containing protein [Niastella yeongjuensis]